MSNIERLSNFIIRHSVLVTNNLAGLFSDYLYLHATFYFNPRLISKNAIE